MLQRKVFEFIEESFENDEINYIDSMRNKLSDFYLSLFSIVVLVLLIASLYRAEDIELQPIFTMHLILSGLLFTVFIFRKKIHATKKAILLIILSYLAGLSAFLQFGVLSAGVIFFPLVSILSFVLLDLKYFYLTTFLSVSTMLFIGYFYPDDAIKSNIDMYAYILLLLSLLPGLGVILYSLYGVLDKAKSQKKELLYLNEKLRDLSITDNLTQIHNRMGIDEALKSELDRLQRYEHHFGIILVDIDNFKKINDTYGHDIGDIVLIDVVKILKDYIRVSDVIGRWGGEEFLIICSEINEVDINRLAETLRMNIELHHFDNVQAVTCSFGTAIADKKSSIENLLKRSTQALYKAKENGKNMVYPG